MMHQNLNALSHKDKNNHKEGRKDRIWYYSLLIYDFCTLWAIIFFAYLPTHTQHTSNRTLKNGPFAVLCGHTVHSKRWIIPKYVDGVQKWTALCYFRDFIVLLGFDPWHTKYVYGFLNQWYFILLHYLSMFVTIQLYWLEILAPWEVTQ